MALGKIKGGKDNWCYAAREIFCGNVAWDILYTPGFHYWNLL